jgi:hypothetical protein
MEEVATVLRLVCQPRKFDMSHPQQELRYVHAYTDDVSLEFREWLEGNCSGNCGDELEIISQIEAGHVERGGWYTDSGMSGIGLAIEEMFCTPSFREVVGIPHVESPRGRLFAFRAFLYITLCHRRDGEGPVSKYPIWDTTVGQVMVIAVLCAIKAEDKELRFQVAGLLAASYLMDRKRLDVAGLDANSPDEAVADSAATGQLYSALSELLLELLEHHPRIPVAFGERFADCAEGFSLPEGLNTGNVMDVFLRSVQG